jgi:hypothetical protein
MRRLTGGVSNNHAESVDCPFGTGYFGTAWSPAFRDIIRGHYE